MNKLRANPWYKGVVAVLLAAGIIVGGVCVAGVIWMIGEEYYRFAEIDPADPHLRLEEVSFEETGEAQYALSSAMWNIKENLSVSLLGENTLPGEGLTVLSETLLPDGRRLVVDIGEAWLNNTEARFYTPGGELLHEIPAWGKDTMLTLPGAPGLTASVQAGVDSSGQPQLSAWYSSSYDLGTTPGEGAFEAARSECIYVTREELIEFAKEYSEEFFFEPGEDWGVSTPVVVSEGDLSAWYNTVEVQAAEHFGRSEYLVISRPGEPLVLAYAYNVLDCYIDEAYGTGFHDYGYDENNRLYYFYRYTSEEVETVTELVCELTLVPPPEYDGGLLLYRAVYDRLYPLRVTLPAVGGAALLTALLCFVLLCFAAGWKKGYDAPKRALADKIPLEAYCGIYFVAAVLIKIVCGELADSSDLAAFALGAVCLLVAGVLFCMSIIRRIKTRTLLKNTLGAYLVRSAVQFVRALPTIWLIVLGCAVYGFVTLVCILSMEAAAVVLWAIVSLVLFAGMCIFDFQLSGIIKAAGRIAKGEAGERVDTERLLPQLKSHAESINSIGDSVSAAVDARMKSERMKTDLIANVSHDIKTPLTSVINYIDLLSRTKITDPTALEYIAVLERQSVRLKRMVEDIVEASKASSGCISADIRPVNLRELLDQATAEYTERLQAGSITPVVTVEEGGTGVLADGRLLWRVFDNLLSNICKYSQAGTRAYIKAARTGDIAEVSFRNISSESLDIPVDTLMERFIRGDRSRHTEGSGLGLSIAQSLTELQGGQLRLSIDGDLFRAAVLLPACDLPQTTPAQPAPAQERAANAATAVPAQPTCMTAAPAAEPATVVAPAAATPEDEWLELPSLAEPEKTE